MSGTLEAVLFDVDGTLVDSERLWFLAEAATMAWLGWQGSWGPEHQEELVGGSIDKTVTYLLKVADVRADRAEVAGHLLSGVEALLRQEVPLMPGAKDLLSEVQAAGVPAALVTSTGRKITECVLDGIGREYFATTLTGDEVTHPKPDPEPYLTAAARLGADPARCVALEDSPTGVASAEAAGCVVVAIPSVTPIRPAPGRTVVGSLADLDLAGLRALIRP